MISDVTTLVLYLKGEFPSSCISISKWNDASFKQEQQFSIYSVAKGTPPILAREQVGNKHGAGQPSTFIPPMTSDSNY